MRETDWHECARLIGREADWHACARLTGMCESAKAFVRLRAREHLCALKNLCMRLFSTRDIGSYLRVGSRAIGAHMTLVRARLMRI